MIVVIMSGFPGSGKTRHARGIPQSVSVSADHHLPKHPTPADFGPAHQKCFLQFLNFLREDSVPVVVVDNTNLSAWEASPYVLAAEAHGCEVEVRRIHCPEEVAWARQVHDVPRTTFDRMVTTFKARDVLPWWRVVEVPYEVGK